MARRCTEHPSCSLPPHLTVADVELIRVPARPGTDALGRPHRDHVEVHYQGRMIATMRDDGFLRHESLGGGWVSDWIAFAGGAQIPTGHLRGPHDDGYRGASREAALRTALDYCTRAAFHIRMALHG